MILQIIFWVIVALITFKVWMKLVRLMEIKEEQRRNEITARIARYHILNTLTKILKELKGGLKDGKNKGRKRTT